MITNPVLAGFRPDPSICRVGDDYYLATSTFEWFPGVMLHHSRDLVNWRPIGHALTRRSQLDLRGVGCSAGSWAPSLSHADGKFWLIYTNVVTTGMGRPFKDPHVYLVTAELIDGPWSDPVKLDSIGFDPSLFHDGDGRKWLCNMQWDFRPGRHRFAGIVLQEYDASTQRLTGPVHELLRKEHILCEGPNLYKLNGYYYLMLAEGGTGWNHGVSMARSRSLTGPYELDPAEAVLTTRHAPEHPLQKAGHGELVQTAAGEWWLAHLCSRPLRTGATLNSSSPDKTASAVAHAGDRCVLGRETALQRVEWSPDGWLRLAHEGVLPAVTLPSPAGLAPHPWPAVSTRTRFDGPVALETRWQSLRRPIEKDWADFSARLGWLRLAGGESPHSLHDQCLLAQRLETFRATATTRVEFAPKRFTQFAGLVCWYDVRTHYALNVTHDENLGRVVRVQLSDDSAYAEPPDAVLAINDWPAAVWLRAEIDRAELRFLASPDGENWGRVGGVFDMTKLSDDHGSILHFTGAMIGVACRDVAGQRAFADFEFFDLFPSLMITIAPSPAVTEFRPGEVWPDIEGRPINAHGGGFLAHGGVVYWYGEHKIDGEAGNAAHVGVRVYSSTDLLNWRDEGIALAVSTEPGHDIEAGCILERPKVVFNAATRRFVMWFHLEPKGGGYRGARSGVAIADSPTGPFRHIGSFRPNAGVWPENVPVENRRTLSAEEATRVAALELPGGPVPYYPRDIIYRRDFAGGQMARDMTLFVDDDGSAYHLYSSEDNGTLHISLLSEDYLRPAGRYVRIFPGRFNEAPTIFKHQGRYHLITSDCSGWTPNTARVAIADSIWGPWQELGNPCLGNGRQTATTFEAQGTFVLPVPGRPGAFIFAADRWNPKNASDGRYVWLPIRFLHGAPVIRWHERWDLSVFD